MGYRLPVTEVAEEAWHEQATNDPRKLTFAIETKGRKLVGIISLANIDWICRTAQLGIVIGDRKWRGKGIGGDALKLLLGYAFLTLNLHRIELRVLASNTSPIKLYKSGGFVVEGRLREAFYSSGAFVDVLVMGLLREDYDNRASAEAVKG